MPETVSKLQSVEAWLSASGHPLKPEFLAIRRLVLDAAPGIAESVKWNAPNFYTSTDFATFQLRARDAVQLVLHFGAKRRSHPISAADISDPDRLLDWLGPDRAAVRFHDMADVLANQSAFTAIIRQWIAHVRQDIKRALALAQAEPDGPSTPEVSP